MSIFLVGGKLPHHRSQQPAEAGRRGACRLLLAANEVGHMDLRDGLGSSFEKNQLFPGR
ncbi:MAG: hypothetical protein ACYC4B_03645 [Pirellulaceae bacterium]